MAQPMEKPAPTRDTDQSPRAEENAIRVRLLQMIVENEEARKSKLQ